MSTLSAHIVRFRGITCSATRRSFSQQLQGPNKKFLILLKTLSCFFSFACIPMSDSWLLSPSNLRLPRLNTCDGRTTANPHTFIYQFLCPDFLTQCRNCFFENFKGLSYHQALKTSDASSTLSRASVTASTIGGFRRFSFVLALAVCSRHKHIDLNPLTNLIYHDHALGIRKRNWQYLRRH
jgi:hypothetical protein